MESFNFGYALGGFLVALGIFLIIIGIIDPSGSFAIPAGALVLILAGLSVNAGRRGRKAPKE